MHTKPLPDLIRGELGGYRATERTHSLLPSLPCFCASILTTTITVRAAMHVCLIIAPAACWGHHSCRHPCPSQRARPARRWHRDASATASQNTGVCQCPHGRAGVQHDVRAAALEMACRSGCRSHRATCRLCAKRLTLSLSLPRSEASGRLITATLFVEGLTQPRTTLFMNFLESAEEIVLFAFLAHTHSIGFFPQGRGQCGGQRYPAAGR